MTKQKLEQISAAVDGEHQDDAILGDIAGSKEHQQTWQRYHLIRDLMREEVSDAGFIDISQQVANAIEAEPTVLAPQKKLSWVPSMASVIPLVRQGGQYAIAASVAAAMILGYQQMNQPSPEIPFSTATVPVVPGIQGGLSPVSLEQTRSLPRTDASLQRQRFNAYLNDHRQQVRTKPTAPEVDAKDDENKDEKAQ